MKNVHNTEGFTLFEVIVALIVFAILATAIYSSHMMIFRMITARNAEWNAYVAMQNEYLSSIRNIELGKSTPEKAFLTGHTVKNERSPFTITIAGKASDDKSSLFAITKQSGQVRLAAKEEGLGLGDRTVNLFLPIFIPKKEEEKTEKGPSKKGETKQKEGGKEIKTATEGRSGTP